MKMKRSSVWAQILLVSAYFSAVAMATDAVAKASTSGPANTTSATPTNVRCIVCDDLKDQFCEPWDHFSHSKDCRLEERIDKTREIGCRKMIQSIGSRTYVSRHCTNLVDGNIQGCIDRVGTKKIKVVYCHCKGNDCNSATGVASAGGWAVRALALAVLGFIAA